MKFIHQIFAIFTALVFLLGATGISIYHHTCYTHHANETVVYPGIFASTSGCICHETADAGLGCHPETTCCGGSCLHPEDSSEPGANCYFESSSCCTSETLFLKLSADFLPGIIDVAVFDLPSILLTIYEATPILTDQPEPSGYRLFDHFSLPFSGRALIFFLHQIKVPEFPLS